MRAPLLTALLSLSLACVVVSACLNVTPYPTIDAGSASDGGVDDEAGMDAAEDGDATTTANDGGAG